MISLLQLDTNFPRIAGDVANPDTYTCPLEIQIVENASVQRIVNDDVSQHPLDGFVDALGQASGTVVTTSCGFLSCHQQHLESLTAKPFVSSALTELDWLCGRYEPEQIAVLTFNVDALGAAHFKHMLPDGVDWRRLKLIGLAQTCHLRHVIENNLRSLDTELAQREILQQLEREFGQQTPACLLLECTNLPPYKAAIAQKFGLDVYDILTAIERVRPNSINSAFL